MATSGSKAAKLNLSKKRTTKTKGPKNAVARTWDVLKLLKDLGSQGASREVLASHCSTSIRTMTRFMRRMEHAGIPVYIRKSTIDNHSRWALDVEELLKEFTPSLLYILATLLATLLDHGGLL